MATALEAYTMDTACYLCAATTAIHHFNLAQSNCGFACCGGPTHLQQKDLDRKLVVVTPLAHNNQYLTNSKIYDNM